MVAVCSDTTIHRRYLNVTGRRLIKILTLESILITGWCHIVDWVMGLGVLLEAEHAAKLGALIETGPTARDTLNGDRSAR
jgi:hypothetical protein